MDDLYQEAFDDVLRGEPKRWEQERLYRQLRNRIVGTTTGRLSMGAVLAAYHYGGNIQEAPRIAHIDMAQIEQRVLAELAHE